MDISTLSRSDLITLKRELVAFKALKKSLGNRARQVYEAQKSGAIFVIVEHPSTISSEDARALAQSSLGNKIPPAAEITERVNETLIGGIRVFIADMMSDVSFASVQKQLLK